MKTYFPFLHWLLSALVFTLLLSTSSIRATADISNTGTSVFLPIIMRPSVSGSDTVTGVLDNGGYVKTPGGVGIGALDFSLQSPITVTITNTTNPGIPLPPLALVIGDYYQFSSSRKLSPPADNPFILAFPVPNSVVTSTLALGVLETVDEVLDTDATSPEWATLEGVYDPIKKLFLTTTNNLKPAGQVYVLLSQPSFNSPAEITPGEALTAAAPNTVPFAVYCEYFTTSGECTSATEQAVATYLNQIHQRIQGDLAFKEPCLRSRIASLSFAPNSYVPDNYFAYIEPRYYGVCKAAAGYYDITESRLVLCFDPAIGLNADTPQTLVHEYFHATEYGYAQVLADSDIGLNEAWIIEGMAMSAEESYFLNEMQRTLVGGWVQLHDVDIPINDPGNKTQLYEYFAQDFWVYAGQHNTQNLSYLKSVLNLGSITQDVGDALGSGNDLDMYWLWAKNQAMEATVNFDGALTSPCQLESNVVKQVDQFNYVFGSNVYHIFTLKPLQSIVIKINFDHNYTGAASNGYPINYNLPSAVASMKFKLYKDGEAGCVAVPDGNRTYLNVTTTGDYYAVVSNIDVNKTFDYLIGFETWPIPTP